MSRWDASDANEEKKDDRAKWNHVIALTKTTWERPSARKRRDRKRADQQDGGSRLCPEHGGEFEECTACRWVARATAREAGRQNRRSGRTGGRRQRIQRVRFQTEVISIVGNMSRGKPKITGAALKPLSVAPVQRRAHDRGGKANDTHGAGDIVDTTTVTDRLSRRNRSGSGPP